MFSLSILYLIVRVMDWWLFSGRSSSLSCGISQQVVSELSGFDREYFRSGGANQFGECLQFRSEVKI